MKSSLTATLSSALCALCYVLAWNSEGWFRIYMIIAGSVFGAFALLVMVLTSKG